MAVHFFGAVSSLSVLRPVEDVLGLLDRGLGVSNLWVHLVIFQAKDIDEFHALENLHDHSVMVEETMDFGEVVLLLLEAVS